MHTKLYRDYCIIIIAISLLSGADIAYGWWSEPLEDNHELLSKDALSSQALSEAEFPDIKKYGEVIWGATEGNMDDASAHDGDSSANDGPAMLWWTSALEEYRRFNFGDEQGAYWYMGQMIHLVEDMAVPVHALDINHYNGLEDLLNPDNFEYFAANNYSASSVTVESGWNFIYPSDYKDEVKKYTVNLINNDIGVTPPTKTGLDGWNYYWIYQSYTDPNNDRFPSTSDIADVEEKLLVENQFGKARNYSAGALIAASKKLPPLIESLEITPSASSTPVIDIQNGTAVTVKILENRIQTVSLYMKIDDLYFIEGGNGTSVTLETGTRLSWEKTHIVTWKGKLEDGTYPSPGVHTLSVYAVDGEDGNQSDISTQEVLFETELPSVIEILSDTILTMSGSPYKGTRHINEGVNLTVESGVIVDGLINVDGVLTIQPDVTINGSINVITGQILAAGNNDSPITIVGTVSIGGSQQNSISYCKINGDISVSNAELGISGSQIKSDSQQNNISYCEINGDISVSNAELEISDSQITSNKKGVLIGSASDVVIQNNTFDSSDCIVYGQSGIEINNTLPGSPLYAMIENNLIQHMTDGINFFPSESAVCDSSVNVTVRFNTLVNNTNGITSSSGCNIIGVIENNIITHSQYGIYGFGSNSTQRGYNNIWNNTVDDYFDSDKADSDTSADPLYLNYMNTCGGDFHLQDTSPCKTSGTTGGEIGAYGLLINTFTLKDVIVGLKILSGSDINPVNSNADADRNSKIETIDIIIILQDIADLKM